MEEAARSLDSKSISRCGGVSRAPFVLRAARLPCVDACLIIPTHNEARQVREAPCWKAVSAVPEMTHRGPDVDRPRVPSGRAVGRNSMLPSMWSTPGDVNGAEAEIPS